METAATILDGHVVRDDGHIRGPQRIPHRREGGRDKRLLAFLRLDGFLLRAVRLCDSESGDAYLIGIKPTLARRLSQGLRPPHVVVGNPPLSDGRLQNLVAEIWGPDAGFYLAGVPTRRRIEFKEAGGKTHQDWSGANRDFGYITSRFPF